METKICVAISTRNRPLEFAKTYAKWKEHLPLNASLVIVDDASDNIYFDADFRFNERAGLPKVKNKCLDLAVEMEADHIFLSDDDCYPILDDWYLPYVNSGINHLCYTFTGAYAYVGKRSNPVEKDGFMVHQLASGCMMYFTSKCIETVGGFDERFGIGLYEHVEMNRRIFNAGLTPYRNMDIIGSNKLFHSMDEHNEVERSFTRAERKELLASGGKIFHSTVQSKNYIEFRDAKI